MPKTVNDAGPVSGYLTRWIERLAIREHDKALDLPCGGGRHSLYLAERGFDVVAADIDPSRLQRLTSCLATDATPNISMVLADATEPAPLKDNIFGLVVTTHFVSSAWMRQVPHLLRSGGHFIYESFGGQGQNWRGLPTRGEIAAQLSLHFELLDYRERACGPSDAAAVAVQAVARRR